MDVVPESRHFLGVEMQGYRRVLTVVDFRGRALFADIDERPCDGYEENMELVRKMIHRALEATGLTLGEIDGIGFCVPGLVNSDSGVLDTRPSYGWLRKGIRADAAAMLAYDGPISVENNACARAYGAQLFQWEKLASAPTFAYLLVSRGIACRWCSTPPRPSAPWWGPARWGTWSWNPTAGHAAAGTGDAWRPTPATGPC